MYATENHLYQALRRRVPTWHIFRIETSTLAGVPDVECCAPNGSEQWIELKVADLPKRSGTTIKVRIRPAQVVWMVKRARMNGRAFLLLALGNKVYLFGAGTVRWLAAPEGHTLEEIRNAALAVSDGASSLWTEVVSVLRGDQHHVATA